MNTKHLSYLIYLTTSVIHITHIDPFLRVSAAFNRHEHFPNQSPHRGHRNASKLDFRLRANIRFLKLEHHSSYYDSMSHLRRRLINSHQSNPLLEHILFVYNAALLHRRWIDKKIDRHCVAGNTLLTKTRFGGGLLIPTLSLCTITNHVLYISTLY